MGFTLVELLIVIAVIAIVSSLAVPKLMSSRLAANESAAISNLRAITSSQEQFRSMNAIDSDNDGGGEYGYLGELAGVAGLREFSGGGATVGGALLQPGVLPVGFGHLEADGSGEGVASRSGYFYKIFLPDVTAGGAVPAIGEDGGAVGGATLGSEPNAQNCEILWCAYAWPIEAHKTGNRVFFVSQDGEVLQYANKDAAYEGLGSAPPFDAAYSSSSPGDMNGPLAIIEDDANDGKHWTSLD